MYECVYLVLWRTLGKESQWLLATMRLWKRGLEPGPYIRYHEAHTQLYGICLSNLEMVMCSFAKKTKQKHNTFRD